jgi:hypothetical protein
MTEITLRPAGRRKTALRAVLAAAVGVFVLCAGYLWLTRTKADDRPGHWVRLQKASLFAWEKRVYAGSLRPMESGERLFLYNNPFIESEANLELFVQYDRNLGGVQRLVLELGGTRYHIHKRHAPLPRMRRGSRPSARPAAPLAPPSASGQDADASTPRTGLLKDYAIRDESRREYLPNGETAEALVKQALEIAEKRLAEARAVFQKALIKAREKAGSGVKPAPR